MRKILYILMFVYFFLGVNNDIHIIFIYIQTYTYIYISSRKNHSFSPALGTIITGIFARTKKGLNVNFIAYGKTASWLVK